MSDYRPDECADNKPDGLHFQLKCLLVVVANKRRRIDVEGGLDIGSRFVLMREIFRSEWNFKILQKATLIYWGNLYLT
jgi:hypothetical protein